MLNYVKLKYPVCTYNPKFNINSINPDSDHLVTLIISEENGKVSCSQSEIPGNFGTYISSIIKGDFSIYILSMVNEKLMAKSIPINTEELSEFKCDKIIYIKNEIEPNELFTINIKIPNKTKEDDEEFEIKFNLKLWNKNLSEILLPCNFRFILSSLKLKIECLDYDIIIQDNELFLGTTYLEENEVINFKVKCLNEDINMDFKFTYKGNEDNEAQEPKLIVDKNNFKIIIAKEYEKVNIKEQNFNTKLFSAVLFIHITNEIFVPINIVTKIVPFKFKITAYDFYNVDNAAEKELLVFYGPEQLKKEQKLFFKIRLSDSKKKYEGNIKLEYISDDNNIRIDEVSIKNKFEIIEESKFHITYTIFKEYMYDIQLKIKIEINSYREKFLVIFRFSPPLFNEEQNINYKYYPTLIPLYIYKKDSDEKFNLKQQNNTNISEKLKQNIFVTPYEISEINPFLYYGDYIEFSLDIDEKDNKFYELDNEGNLLVNTSNKSKYKYKPEMQNEAFFNIFIGRKNFVNYSTISFPLIGVYKGVWYPTVYSFRIEEKVGHQILKYEEDNSEKTEELINISKYNKSNFFWIYTILELLSKEKVFKKIEKIIEGLPSEIKEKIYKNIDLKPIPDDIKKKAGGNLDKLYNEKPELFKGTIFELFKENKIHKLNILKSNILLSFWTIFYIRYIELKQNGFRDFILTTKKEKEEFIKNVNDMRNKYFCINKEPKINDNFGIDELNIAKRFISSFEKDKKKYLNENDKNHFPVIKMIQYDNKYIYQEFNKDGSNKADNSIILQKEKIKRASSMLLTSDINLPELKRPENDFTLNKLIQFYNDAIKSTRILPIFIRSALKNNDDNQKKRAEECLSLLLNTYKALKPEARSSFKDTSFLCKYVNDFILSFEKMISKLKKAGLRIDFDLYDDEENTNEIVKLPEKERLDEKNNSWNIFKKPEFNDIEQSIFNKYKYEQNMNGNKELDNEINNDINSFNENDINEDENVPNDNQINQDINSTPLNIKKVTGNNEKTVKIDSNVITINQTDIEYNDFDQQKDFETTDFIRITIENKNSNMENINPQKQEQNSNIQTMKLNSNAINKMTINPKSFGKKNILFNERDGIEKSIIKIGAMDDNEKFSYEYKKLDNYYPKSMESKESDLITIKNMVDSSKYISQIFIKNFTENDIPFLNEGVTILIDCSGYINKENKLFNMHLICGLTEGLYSIGMPYSVALISDENFKRIIKKFDTPHSIYELQKIYECYMIPRYRTNLAKSIHFAIDNLKYTSYSTGMGKVSNTAYFIFTDGMDENLYFGNDFKNYLFNNPNLSFGFVFIKSSLLSVEYNKILENLWNKFRAETKGSISKILIEISENKFEIKKIYSIIEMIVKILSRNIEEQNYKIENYPLEKAVFELPSKEELNSDTLNMMVNCGYEHISHDDKIFYNISQIRYNKLKEDKLDSNLYNNKIGKIMNCKISDSIKNEYKKILNNFIIPKNKINISLLDQIFLPNKPSTMILSTTGSEIDIPAFIKYLFENNPNPMIYLEKKGGFTKHYSVSIIIDSSLSCLNKFSLPHTIYTISYLISSLASINIPAVDIIIATSNNPIVICSDIPSIKLFGKSNILTSIFKVLTNPCLKANLPSALKVAKDLQKMGSKDTTKYMLVLTDGLYQENELELIKNRIFDCMQNSLLIGIGIGFYPLKIKRLFVQNIYVPNPYKLITGIGISTAKSNVKYTSTMPYLDIKPIKPEAFDLVLEELLKTDNPINKDLIKELENIEIEIDAFSDFYNAEKEQYDNSGSLMNPIGKNKSMYSKGFLEGHEILFVCLYNCDMNPNEDKCTDHKYLFERSPKANYYFNECAKHYGVKVKLVLDYEEAINEIIKPWENDPKKCKYYAVWIVCGPPYPMLPKNNGKKSDPYLLGQFMKVINMYNENGGSLIFLTESDPLFYQANLFLRDLYLYDKKGKKVKVNLQLEGEHKGDTVLVGDKSGELKKAGLFNKSSQSFKNLTRSSLSHNLVSYYEGYTIDFADYNKVMNSPFYPFARDSDGGVAGFFYPADIDGRGDIVFNCSYTSLYYTKNKENDGTYRYYENIIAWTSRPEVHLKYDECLIKDYRPKKVDYIIDGSKWTEFKEMPIKEITEKELKTMKTLFCIDASGSVGGQALYHTVTKIIFNKFYKIGDLIYLWGSIEPKRIELSKFRDWNDNKSSGFNGTASDTIADIISRERNSGIEHLVIITDGSVDPGSIDKSDNKMKSLKSQYNFSFKFVSTYIIASSGGDRSVGAPYCRGVPSVTYMCRNTMESNFQKLASLNGYQIKLLEDFLNNNIRTYQQFISKYKDLEVVLESEMYGKEANSKFLNALKIMYTNIPKDKLTEDFNKKYDKLYKICNGALRNNYNFSAH